MVKLLFLSLQIRPPIMISKWVIRMNKFLSNHSHLLPSKYLQISPLQIPQFDPRSEFLLNCHASIWHRQCKEEEIFVIYERTTVPKSTNGHHFWMIGPWYYINIEADSKSQPWQLQLTYVSNHKSKLWEVVRTPQPEWWVVIRTQLKSLARMLGSKRERVCPAQNPTPIV